MTSAATAADLAARADKQRADLTAWVKQRVEDRVRIVQRNRNERISAMLQAHDVAEHELVAWVRENLA